MTETELSGFAYIQTEIEILKEELSSLSSMEDIIFASPIRDGMPRKKKITDPTGDTAITICMLREKIEEEIKEKIKKLYKKRIKIESFLDSIEEEEMKLIFRMRYIDQISWREIGDKIHMDHTTAYRKHKKYLYNQKKKMKNATKTTPK